jgi:hypothetical protein
MSTTSLILNRFGVVEGDSPILINGSRYKELPKLFWKLGFRIGVEIGVCSGRYSEIICRYNPKVKLFCVDPWQDYDEYPERHLHKNGFAIDVAKDHEDAKSRLSKYNCTLIRDFSVDVARNFIDESLDFIYIDGNHSFPYVIADLAAWSRKVKVGGIISGHDYYNTREEAGRKWSRSMPKDELKLLCQVKDAIDAWTKTNEIKPWFVLTQEKSPSWFWVKE